MQQPFAADNSTIVLDGEIDSDVRMVDVTPRRLSKKQKAAVIVRLLLGHGVSLGVSKLPPEDQNNLAHTIAALGNVDKPTLAEVVQEFTRQIDNLALSFPRDLSETVELLEPYLAPGALGKLRAAAERTDTTDPWARISRQPVERLRPLLSSESAEVCSVLLSKLGVAKAAELLGELPAERSDILAHSMALTETITPDLVERIGLHLAGVLDSAPVNAFEKAAAERVGAILNATPQEARDRMLEGLQARDEPFAAEVRKSIFAFPHIPARVEPADVPLIMRKVDGDTAVTALAAGKGAAPLTVEFLLENMSKRLAEQMRDDADARNAPKPEEGEAAMAEVIASIRELEAEGEITLLPPED
ncbi:FliG C-terminal domain-containing protein [Gymnodinialimonas hymeniacidonis]|uniref:FliG C-terminal domain-containing protein n=1 Tax=Gymnodinialimonas hymeniacidonis TaxID=3126508 RepID=UPI0034C61AB6